MNSVAERIIEWSKSNDISLDEEEIMGARMEDQMAFDNALVNAFSETAFFAFSEQGCPPGEFLPGVLSGYLEQITEREFDLNSVVSEDDWKTARAIISCDGEDIELKIDYVNDSDWVPPELAGQMKNFSKKYCEKLLYTLYGEDPFVVLYLSENAISALDSIRNTLPEPQCNR